MPVKAPMTRCLEAGFRIETESQRPESALSLVESMGDVIDVTDVRLRANARSHLACPDEIPLHTDHPLVQMIAWYCHQNDDIEGAQHLADGRAAFRMLPPQTQDTLSTIHLWCPPLMSLDPQSRHPLLNMMTGQIFFAPWLVPKDLSGAQIAALNAFMTLLQHEPTIQKTVFLKPGQILILDNHRFLHGRGALHLQSKRWLTRYWIQTANAQPLASGLGSIENQRGKNNH